MSDDSILIYGGTFDPPHRAHIELPARAADELACTRIVYVPTSSNPLKGESPTPARHRLAMLEIALRDCPWSEISTLEIDQEGPSYTVDTLRTIRDCEGAEARLYLLIGADAAATFHRWREPREILRIARPAVMLRPPFDRARLRQALAPHWSAGEVEQWMSWIVDVPVMHIDATALRERIARREDVGDEIDPRAMAYIRKNDLYVAA